MSGLLFSGKLRKTHASRIRVLIRQYCYYLTGNPEQRRSTSSVFNDSPLVAAAAASGAGFL